MAFSYADLIERRKALNIKPYATLADVGCDGPWITPYQISSRNEIGPALVALHWLDQATIQANRPILLEKGFLPNIRFNRVLDVALAMRGLTRANIYVTQAFHLIPNARSEQISKEALDISFDQITRHELVGRKVVALGAVAASPCANHGIAHEQTCHPSRRAASNQTNASDIAAAIGRLGF